MKKRIIIATILIILALVLCFVISPWIQSKSSGNASVIRCAKNIKKGSVITEDDIERVNVGKYNLQNNILTKENEILGKISTCDMYKYDYFTKDKLTDSSDERQNSVYKLNGDKRIYSLSVPSLSSGVGNMLECGDIVSCICTENGISFIPAELKYLKVISLTDSQGKNIEDSDKGFYTCVTFECTEEECIALSEYSKSGNITLAMVCKYDSEMYHTLGF